MWTASACTPAPAAPEGLQIALIDAGGKTAVEVPAGSTAADVLEAAGVELGPLDRTEPPLDAALEDGDTVRLVHVREEFEVEEIVLPFERKTLRNESLPEDTQVLLQKGQNGLQEITTRRVYEDGVAVDGGTVIKRVTVTEPVAEIVMFGVQSPYRPVAIPGKLVYLRDGNAWVMSETTGSRQAVVATGDLDGRIFALSSDGGWLLFTRRASEEGHINELWAADISGETSSLIDLKVPDVVHFADWVPGSSSKVVFSTVEARSAAPGWQANNDLNVLSFSRNGWISKWKEKPVLEPNSGGVYGWWGTNFAWSPDRQRLAFARPDQVSVIEFVDGEIAPLMAIIPYQTRSDWAWVPGLAWSPDGKTIYTVEHSVPPGAALPEESPLFDLTALSTSGGPPVHLVKNTGMFAYPLISPPQMGPSGKLSYQIAYLQAVFPDQSQTSPYRLAVVDPDGARRRALFPDEEISGGLQPQREWGAWSPNPLPESDGYAIALIYQGNLWLVDTTTGETQQVTGDGLTTRVIWE